MFLKLLKRVTVGQAVPEIPLSVGSKLELHVLLRAFVFARFPYTSPYTHAFVRVCILLSPRTLTHLSAYAYRLPSIRAHNAYYESRYAHETRIVDCVHSGIRPSPRPRPSLSPSPSPSPLALPLA